MHTVSRRTGYGALLACLLPAAFPVAAQETAAPPEDEELGTISLEGSRHASDPVFEGDMPDALEGGMPEPPETSAQKLRRLFRLYRDAVADAMYGEADVLAKQIVELSIATHWARQHGNGTRDHQPGDRPARQRRLRVRRTQFQCGDRDHRTGRRPAE
ncbi:MAG: hypothetical protein U5K76_13045 [Woeseiaceae bacterium]|nr:hypothetical protein [Woeseiaceae bacterium]